MKNNKVSHLHPAGSKERSRTRKVYRLSDYRRPKLASNRSAQPAAKKLMFENVVNPGKLITLSMTTPIQKLRDTHGDEIADVIQSWYGQDQIKYKAVGAILNAILTHGRLVFNLSRDPLSQLLKDDPNLKIQSSIDHKAFEATKALLFQGEVFLRIREGDRFKREASTYQLTAELLLPLILKGRTHESVLRNELKQLEDWINTRRSTRSNKLGNSEREPDVPDEDDNDTPDFDDHQINAMHAEEEEALRSQEEKAQREKLGIQNPETEVTKPEEQDDEFKSFKNPKVKKSKFYKIEHQDTKKEAFAKKTRIEKEYPYPRGCISNGNIAPELINAVQDDVMEYYDNRLDLYDAFKEIAPVIQLKLQNAGYYLQTHEKEVRHLLEYCKDIAFFYQEFHDKTSGDALA